MASLIITELMYLFVRSGSINRYEYVGGVGYQQRGAYKMGQDGYLWSSRGYYGSGGSLAYALHFSSNVSPSNLNYYNDRVHGYSLRCLAS